MRTTHLRDLFASDPDRARRFTFAIGDLTVDFSKHRITDDTVQLLTALASEAGVEDRRDAMFRGDHINTSEDRAVLHTALRAQRPIIVDRSDVVPDVRDVVARMGTTASKIRDGVWMGATGQSIRAIVNIGIGGSDLGPLMVVRALRHLKAPHLDVRFVSNIDSAHLDQALEGLDPTTTLFVVASKTFTTIETMTNARSARQWLLNGLPAGVRDTAIAQHFVALSTNAAGVGDFGIDTANMFPFWDWVGGRYSVDSAIGFSLMCSIGPAAFDEFLAGFRIVDDHFASTAAHENVPLLSGLIGVWYRNFFGWQSHAVLPYTQALDRFPAYLQQLDMESNGKSVGHDGKPVQMHTAPVIWGEPGTNGQHAFYQLLHQGTTPVPCDLIGFLSPEPGLVDGLPRDEHHELLVANLIAQAQALAFGRAAPAGEPHRAFAGNRPTTLITAPALTASVLGQLIALYEHRVFTQGAVWGINSFDQWGVELGKILATAIRSELAPGAAIGDHDSSTIAAINRFRQR